MLITSERKLHLVKYNNKIKGRLNIDLIDYKNLVGNTLQAKKMEKEKNIP